MLTRDLEYELPPELIATDAAEPRDAARLMVVRRAQGLIEHRIVRDLADPAANLLRRGDLLVFNQSRVLPAHFEATRSGTGGRISGLYIRSQPQDDRLWEVMLESGGKLRPGERIAFDDASHLILIARLEAGLWRAKLQGDVATTQLLERIGTVPLPPYISAQRRRHQQPVATPDDLQRYNTVFAREGGSVAAPTAGLHFTRALMDRLGEQGVEQAFVTLHVGLGTFAPIRSERIEEHVMHGEWISVPPQTIAALEAARARGGRIIPVGTTSVRAIESLPPIDQAMRQRGYHGETHLLIYPGAPGAPSSPGAPGSGTDSPLRFTDALLTNFHLPHSTLLALVAALPQVGIDRLKAWYRQAIEQRYRFYSYGDAMLLI